MVRLFLQSVPNIPLKVCTLLIGRSFYNIFFSFPLNKRPQTTTCMFRSDERECETSQGKSLQQQISNTDWSRQTSWSPSSAIVQFGMLSRYWDWTVSKKTYLNKLLLIYMYYILFYPGHGIKMHSVVSPLLKRNQIRDSNIQPAEWRTSPITVKFFFLCSAAAQIMMKLLTAL